MPNSGAKPAARSRALRVLVIDDSTVSRTLLIGFLGTMAGLEVVGGTGSVASARRLISERQPDVLTLDIHMPQGNGLSLLESVMRRKPMPVIVVSALLGGETHTAACARALGAVAVVAKAGSDAGELARFRSEFTAALALARERVFAASARREGARSA